MLISPPVLPPLPPSLRFVVRGKQRHVLRVSGASHSTNPRRQPGSACLLRLSYCHPRLAAGARRHSTRMVYLSLGPLCLRDVRVERIVYLYGCIITVTIYIIQPFEIFRLGLGWSIVGRGGHPCTEQDCIRDQRRGYKGGRSHSLIAMLPKFLFLLLGSPSGSVVRTQLGSLGSQKACCDEVVPVGPPRSHHSRLVQCVPQTIPSIRHSLPYSSPPPTPKAYLTTSSSSYHTIHSFFHRCT